jgi:hypothetical protein
MADSEKKQAEAKTFTSVTIKIPDDVRLGVYANFLNVQKSPWDYTLSFCHIAPPGEKEEAANNLEATVVARVVIASNLMDLVIRALQRSSQRAVEVAEEEEAKNE